MFFSDDENIIFLLKFTVRNQMLLLRLPGSMPAARALQGCLLYYAKNQAAFTRTCSGVCTLVCTLLALMACSVFTQCC